MTTRKENLQHLFDNETGNTVTIPMDHGSMLGVPKGLEDPVQSFKKFVSLRPDALLINFGVLKLMEDYLDELEDRPGIVVAVDFNQFWDDWKIPQDFDGIIGHRNVTSVENAYKYSADAVKVLFPIDLGPELQLDYVDHLSQVINEAEGYNLPVMAEPVTGMGKHVPGKRQNDPNIIADGSRLALELGADILKIPYPGKDGHEEFTRICENSHVPVITLGGPKEGGIRGILETARQVVDAGAKGPIFGRNVWQRPDEETEKIVSALQDIVHDGASVEEAAEKYGL